MLNNLKIGVRLGIGFAITLALLITVAVVGFPPSSSFNSEIQSLVITLFPKTVPATASPKPVTPLRRTSRLPVLFSNAHDEK